MPCVGGWQLSGISTFRNGVPLSLTDDNNTSYSFGGGQTPDQVHTPQKVSRTWNAAGTGIIDFDTSAFQQAASFTFGNTQSEPLVLTWTWNGQNRFLVGEVLHHH